MMTAQQMIAVETKATGTTGFAQEAGIILNAMLQELAQDYDIAVNLFTTTLVVSGSGLNQGMGPYNLPANYLRMAVDELTYQIDQIPYLMTQITLAQMDIQINVVGAADFPNRFATDVSVSNPVPFLYVYPPPSQSITLQMRYYGTRPDIVSPEVSSTTPWFPCQAYLRARLRGELYNMKGAAEKAAVYLGMNVPASMASPISAPAILRHWLQLQGDKEMTGSQVVLDRRYFGSGGQAFAPSKVTGGV